MTGTTRRPPAGAGADFVVVANHLPVDLVRDPAGTEQWKASPGGLVTALESILHANDGAWVAWPGVPDAAPEPFDSEGIHLHSVPLSARDVELYYEGFSNGTIWPLFHDVVVPPAYHREWWYAYREVNTRFAEATADAAAEGATVWVQDYQLLLVPKLLRELRPDLTIGFFLHIPFPPVELFRQLPWRTELMEGMLGADLVGFHLPGGADNFRILANRLSGYTSVRLRSARGRASEIRVGDRLVRVGAFPISIDSAAVDSAARSRETRDRATRLRAELGSPKILMLGVDRLDYTKGIDVRLRAQTDVDALGVVQSIDPQHEDLGRPELGAEPRGTVARLPGTGGGVDGRGIDGDGEGAHPDQPVTHTDLGRAPPGGPQPNRGVPAQTVGEDPEVVGPAGEVKAHQVRAEHALHQLGPPRQLSEQFHGRERDVQEEADGQVGPQFTEELGHQEQLVVLDPHGGALGGGVGGGFGEPGVDLPVGVPPFTVVGGWDHHVVEQRPDGAVGEALVVELHVPGRQGHRVQVDALGVEGLGGRVRDARPGDPGAVVGVEDGLQGGDQPARAGLPLFGPGRVADEIDGEVVGDDDEVGTCPGRRPSGGPGHSSLLPGHWTNVRPPRGPAPPGRSRACPGACGTPRRPLSRRPRSGAPVVRSRPRPAPDRPAGPGCWQMSSVSSCGRCGTVGAHGARGAAPSPGDSTSPISGDGPAKVAGHPLTEHHTGGQRHRDRQGLEHQPQTDTRLVTGQC